MSAKPSPVPDITSRVRTLTGFLSEFLNQHRQRPDRPFCFILGAGASKESKIPTGQEMAAKWLEEIHQHENVENLKLRKWATAERLGIENFNVDNPARHYSKLYERRYLGNEDGGYAFLESVMEKSEPSFGYSVLAYILGETPHKIVITTNFDNLVADALAVHANNFPVVVTDDALVRYVRSKVRRPLIAKVHGSLGFAPKSKTGDIGSLSTDWQSALVEVFRNYTPVVIGYDGNDGSLMSLLESLPAGVPDRIWWCYYSPSGDHRANALALPERIRQLIYDHNGFLVPIAGFDFLMAELLNYVRADLKIPDLHDRLREKSADRLAAYDEQWRELCGGGKSPGDPTTTSTAVDEAPMPEEDTLQDVMSKLAKARATKPWWQWLKEIESVPTSNEKEALYKRAIEANPTSSELLAKYGEFIADTRSDLAEAERLFNQALANEPDNAGVIGVCATFFTEKLGRHDDAESLYRRALAIDPNYQNLRARFSVFLRDVRKDYDASNEFFTLAIEKDPANASYLAGCALLNHMYRKSIAEAEIFYRRAIRVDPRNPYPLGNYGQLLLGTGRIDEGLVYLRTAWLNKDSDIPIVCSELAFALWIGTRLAEAEEENWERVFKGSLPAGPSRPAWNFDLILELAKEKLSPNDFAYAKALADAFLDASKVMDLEELQRWRELKPLDPKLVTPEGSIQAA